MKSSMTGQDKGDHLSLFAGFSINSGSLFILFCILL
jgi:hypothetical protein